MSSKQRPPARYGERMGEHMTDRQWAALPGVLDVDELVRLLGISDQGVWARMRKGTVPAYRVAKFWIVFRDELRAHLEGSTYRVNVLEGYPDVLDADDVGRLFHRSRPTIVDWFAKTHLPGTKDGRFWVVRRKTLRLFLDERSNQPKPVPSRNLVPGSVDEALVDAAHALTIPARIDIIRAVTPYGDVGAYLSDIVDATTVPVGSMRHHLTALQEIGVVRSDIPEEKRHGRAVRYSVDVARLGDIFGRVFAYVLS